MRLPNDFDAPRAAELCVFFDGDALERHLLRAAGPEQRVRVALPNDDEGAAWIELRSRPCLHALRCTSDDERVLPWSAAEPFLVHEGAVRVELAAVTPVPRLPAARRNRLERIALAFLSVIVAACSLLPLFWSFIAFLSLASSSNLRDPNQTLVLSDGMRKMRWESLHQLRPATPNQQRTTRHAAAARTPAGSVTPAAPAPAPRTRTATGRGMAKGPTTALATATVDVEAVARAMVASQAELEKASQSGEVSSVVLGAEARDVLGTLVAGAQTDQPIGLTSDASFVHRDRQADDDAPAGSEGGANAPELALSHLSRATGGGVGGAPGTATIGEDESADDGAIGLGKLGTWSRDGGVGDGHGSRRRSGTTRCMFGHSAVSVCRLTVSGALDRSMIRRVVRAHENEVRGCYEHALEHDRHLAGRVSVDFRIAPDGEVPLSSVYGVELGSDSVEARDVGDCIASAVASWRFQRYASRVGTVRVRYPFLLTPSPLAQALLR